MMLSLLPSVALAKRKVTRDALPTFDVSADLIQEAAAAAPAIDVIHRMVLAHARIDLDAPRSWAKRARSAAALPRLQVGVRHVFKDNFDLALEDNASVTSSGVVVGPRTVDFDEASDRQLQIDVRAIWDLRDLIFTADSIHVSRESRERRKEVRALLHETNLAYNEWLRWRALRKMPRAKVPRATVELQLRAAAAELDALTGGWFSREVKG